MKGYWACIKIDLKLAARNRSVLFFNYLFPLVFFFVFAEMLAPREGGVTTTVVRVLLLGVLGNGLFGAGMRATQEREMNILRRFKVAPITPVPILTASLITGWIMYLPAVTLILLLAHFRYAL